MSFKLYLLFLALTLLRPVEMFAPELAEFRPMVILSLLTFATALTHSVREGKLAAWPMHLKLLGFFIFVIAASQIANGWMGGAVSSVSEFSVAAFMFLTTVMNVTNMKRLRITCTVVAFSAVILAVAGLAAYHTGFMVSQLVLRQNIDADEDSETAADENDIPAEETSKRVLWRVRSISNLSDPNDFGQVLVTTLPMLAGLYVRRRLFRNLLLVGLPTVVVLYTIFLTHSRGALLGLAALLFFGVKNALGTFRTVMLMGIGAGVAMAANMTGGRAYSANEESAGGRIDAWSQGLNMLISHPVLGVGFHNFTEYHPYTAHNTFVLCFAEQGLLGYFMWLGMIILTYKGVTRAISLGQAGSEELRWANLLRSSVLGFFTCALFLSRTYEPNLFLLLALAQSTAYCSQTSAQGMKLVELQSPPSWAKNTLIFEIASIIIIYIVVRLKHLG